MSYHVTGRPVYGQVHATTLTTAVLVPMYEQGVATSGGATAITPSSTERIVITDIWYISNVAADIHTYLSDDNDATPEVGETLLRGTIAANGGHSKGLLGVHRTGAPGADVRVSSDTSATVDVGFTGYIIKV